MQKHDKQADRRKQESLWMAKKAETAARQGKISEPNLLLTLLGEAFQATGEPCFLEAYRMLFIYGLGNFVGSPKRRFKSLATELLCEGKLVQMVDDEISRQTAIEGKPRRGKAYATLAARHGVVAHSLDAAVKQIERAYKARKASSLPADGSSGWIILVGRVPELDELQALRSEIDSFARSSTVELNPSKTSRQEFCLAVKQYEARGAELMINRARVLQSKVPGQLILRDIRYVADNRAARQAIAQGQLVELYRSVTNIGVTSIEVMSET